MSGTKESSRTDELNLPTHARVQDGRQGCSACVGLGKKTEQLTSDCYNECSVRRAWTAMHFEQNWML